MCGLWRGDRRAGRIATEVCEELCALLAKKIKKTAVVMLTSRSSPFDKLRGSLAGCDEYLTKPLDEDELIQRVKKQTNVPVTTGEIWNIWRDDLELAAQEGRPSLASSVDFIAAHILPYWEDFPIKAKFAKPAKSSCAISSSKKTCAKNRKS